MPGQHTEYAFEAAIEHRLTTTGGYEKGNRDPFDQERGIFPKDVIAFIQRTQPREWEYLANIQKEKAEETLLDDLCRALNSDHEGCLSVLRHGFKCFGKLFRVACFAPVSGMNPDTQKLYAANRLTITRQLCYSAKHGNTLDVTLALNGIPVATVELKNPMTAQSWRHAVMQYKNDRDPADLIFQFKKRTLVHFAVDTDEVYMATRLSGRSTCFLPFNKGCGGGAGNPEHPGGYKTAYLWEEVLERFGAEFKPGDQLFFESIREDAVADTSLRQAALANTMENFGYVFRKALEGLFIDRMEQNEEITAKFMNEDRFREAVSLHLLKEVYDQIRNVDAG